MILVDRKTKSTQNLLGDSQQFLLLASLSVRLVGTIRGQPTIFAILDRLKINPTGYEYLIKGLLNQFCKMIGHQCDFAEVSERMGLNWLKGQKAAKAVFK